MKSSKNPVECLKNISEFFEVDLKINNDDLNQIHNVSENLNRGIRGRGEQLEPYYRQLIEDFARAYKNIDFSPIGIYSE